MTNQPTILIGPCSLADRRELIAALDTCAQVDCIDERDAFRRCVLASRYDAIVLYARDADGIPNEPLLQFCLTRIPTRPIVHVLPGATTRVADVGAGNAANLSYYPLPVHPDSNDYVRLAGYVSEIAGSASLLHQADSRDRWPR